MAQESRAVHFLEEQEIVNEAIPFSTEETSCVNDGASGILPGESLDEQLAILESLSLNANSSTTTDNTGLKVIVKYGNIELQKADVLAVPLLATNPVLTALNVTKSLKLTAGDRFSNLFRTVLQSQTPKAGCCIELPTAGGNYSVDSKCVIFIICSKWKNEDNSPEMELRDGIRQLLNKCNSMREVISVAVSAIGTGKALNFSNALAATIMGEEIKRFVDTHPKTNIKEIQIVIKQLQTVYIAYREILLAMDLGQRIKLCNENGDHFINIAYGEHTQIKKGRLTVSVVYGDIVMESTKAIVNPTDFISWGAHTVAEKIFSAAGADIVRNAQKGHNSGQTLVMTTAGPLPCDWILHCNCGGSLNNISNLVSEILDQCERVGLQSVAIPAIGTGECKFRPEDVANCMIEGIKPVTENPTLNFLSCVRLITYSPYIYHTFCAALKKYLI